MVETGFLSLGSNIGIREDNLAGAISALSTYHEINNIESSSFFESEPLFDTNQEKFLNIVVSYSTEFSAFDFFDACQNVEVLLGRPKNHKKNAPRIIDIDILTFGDANIETEQLTVPHPDLTNRRFVLLPWAELAPEFIVPVYKQKVIELLAMCLDGSSVTKHILKKNA